MNTVKKAALLIFFLGLYFNAAGQNQLKPVGPYLHQIVIEQGTEAALAEYNRLKENDSTEFDLNDNQLIGLGGQLTIENQADAAIKILEYVVDTNSSTVMGWYRLGGAYLANYQNNQAVKAYHETLRAIKEADMPAPQKNFLKNNTEVKLLEAEEFIPPSPDTFNYIGFYGGAPGGSWDRRNLAAFKTNTDASISYRGNDLYRSAVPINLEQSFTGPYKADVTGSFAAGYYEQFIEEGKLMDISEFWKSNGWDEVFPASVKKLVTVNDKQYFVPHGLQWNTVWYRKDIFEKHDLEIPQNWNELLTLCETLNEKGITPFTISVQDWTPPILRWFSILNLRLNGSEFHNKVLKGEVAFTDDKIRNVFEHWGKLFEVGAFADSSFANTYASGLNALMKGEAAMYFLGDWIFENIPPDQTDRYHSFRFPVIKESAGSAEIVHTYGMFGVADSDHPELTKALLTYTAGEASQTQWVELTNRVAANRTVGSSFYTEAQEKLYKGIEQTQAIVPLFEFSTRPEFTTKVIEIIKDYWKNPGSIQSTLTRLEQARKEVFDN